MRPQPAGRSAIFALWLGCVVLAAAPSHAQPAGGPGHDAPRAASPAAEADPGATAPNAAAEPAPPPPGLAEATRNAASEVLDAARRDGASWARRTTELQQTATQVVVEQWQSFVADPIPTADAWLAAVGLPDSQTLALPALGLGVALVLLWVLVRGRGDLKVSLEYPAELRGCFSVRIARKRSASRRGPRAASPAAAERLKRKAGAARRNERHLVSRETDFPRIPTGRWFVTVDGFVQPTDDEAVIATYFEEQEVTVVRNHTVRLDFDFHPKHCPVDVKVTWDRRPVSEALVAWRGDPHSLRYARGGPVRLGAPRGELTLVVGSGDRVAELPVSVLSYQPVSLEIDLADRERLLFTGCPPAVEPYLHGDVTDAARFLERDGQNQVASLLLAWQAEDRDQPELAARHYSSAGLPAEAAALHRQLSHFAESAELYESAGELVEAATMYRSAGDASKAGELYERARDYESAATCFRDAGNVSKWCEALEKSGKPFEAARVALEHGDAGRAIRSLQLLSPSDEEYLEAALMLVGVLEKEGHLDLAVEKVAEIGRARGEDAVPLEVCEQLADLLAQSEQHDRALEVLEVVRRRDPARPELAARMEELRKHRQQAIASRATALPGSEVFASGFRYEILEEIGRGGMGIVFKARDRRLGRVVALKRLPDNLRNHPKAVELFLREARAAAALNHPNIVTVHDAGQEGDTYYITMELLEGLTLQQILKRQGRLGPRDVAKLGMQVCAGLHYAHAQRVVHRDIKTGNLFFTVGKVVKIMDFGLAKMMEEVRRASTVIGGTPYYMAPEQSQGVAVDPRADLYALGVTFFELVSGKVPFPDGDVAYHHRHTPPPDPRDRVPGLPDAFAELILEMMSKEPAGRPETAAAVRERLQHVVDSLS